MKYRPRYVIDASALIAVFLGEDGAQSVARAVDRGAAMSVVNWIEVASRLRIEADLDHDEIRSDLRARGWWGDQLRIVPVDDAAVAWAVRLAPVPHGYGLSLADRACLALGRSLSCPVLTSDSPMTWGDFGAEVRHIREWDCKPRPANLPHFRLR